MYLVGDGSSGEGKSMEKPIILEGYLAADFKALLMILYPTYAHRIAANLLQGTNLIPSQSDRPNLWEDLSYQGAMGWCAETLEAVGDARGLHSPSRPHQSQVLISSCDRFGSSPLKGCHASLSTSLQLKKSLWRANTRCPSGSSKG